MFRDDTSIPIDAGFHRFMNPESLAEWFRRQDYRVLRTESSYWVEVSRFIFQAFPFHWTIKPDREEIDSIFSEHKALGVRYSSDVNTARGKLSYHVVYPLDSEEFHLENIPKKARHDIRRGLKFFTLEQIPLSQLAGEGWSVRVETLTRQKRLDAESEGWWRRLCESAEGLPGFEAWAAFDEDGEMAASALVVLCEDVSTILYQQSRTKDLKLGVNNTLAYVITSQMLERPDIHQLFYGLQSLDARPAVDQFKFRMGYLAKPVRQIVDFHPAFSKLVNPASVSILSTVRRVIPLSFFAKANGMMQFYLEGKRPVEDQHWPEVFLRQKGKEFVSQVSFKET